MMDEKEIFFLGYKVGNRIKNALPSLNVINLVISLCSPCFVALLECLL
jgi:hypothetical protein